MRGPPPAWTTAFLNAIHARPTPSNLRFINSWWAAESGGGGGLNNPFNTTQPGFGGTNYNSVGVKNYPTPQAGALATARVLGERFPHYADVLHGLQAGNVSPGVLAGYVMQSPWGTHSFQGLGAAPSGADQAPALPARPAPPPPQQPQPAMTGPDPRLISLALLRLAGGGGGGGGEQQLLGALATRRQPQQQPLPAIQQPTATAAPAAPVQTAGTGKVTLAPGADRPGVRTNPRVIQFVSRIAGIVGRPLTIGTGSNHNQYVAGEGNTVSDHWYGEAADVPATGQDLLRLGRAALIAAGMPRAQALKQTGGVFNVGGYNILFNTNVGGNHFNHLHVGLGRILGRTFR